MNAPRFDALENRAEGATLSPEFIERVLHPKVSVERELTPDEQSRMLTIDHMLSRIEFDLAKLARLKKELLDEQALLRAPTVITTGDKNG